MNEATQLPVVAPGNGDAEIRPRCPVILVDDDRHQRVSAAQTLELAGYEVAAFADPKLAVQRIGRDFPGLVISDMRMPGMDGLDVLAAVRAIDPDLPVVMITGFGDVKLAVEAMRRGAADFIEKPFDTSLLTEVVARAGERRRLVLENRALRGALARSQTEGPTLIGVSAPIARLRAAIAEIAPLPVDVTILGEAGVEAQDVAQAIHLRSTAAGGPFVAVRCAAISPCFADLELFGSARRAANDRDGRIADAAGGTLYLEDIDRLPDATRLRVEDLSRAGTLGARLVVSRIASDAGDDPRDVTGIMGPQVGAIIAVPPLRLRGQDLLHLFYHHLDRAAARFATTAPALSDDEMRTIMLHDWPGNLAELLAEADRYALGMGLSIGAAGEAVAGEPLPNRVAAFERSAIVRELKRTGGSIKATYMALGIPRKTLQDKMRKYGLRRGHFADEA